ncbi:MAG: lysylphosphatidylglycerol synthase transmembrane domain-containing protein [Candidatus Nanoarchaeia archaeon]
MKATKYFAVIGIAIFVYIIYRLKIGNIYSEIKNADVFFILLSLVVLFFGMIMQTAKWHVIAKKQKINVSFKEAIRINFISNFYGFVTPSKLGGVVRAGYLKKDGESIGKGMSNFIIDRILDIASLFFIGIVAIAILGNKFNILPMGYLIGIFFAIAILIYVFVDKERTKKILRVFYIKFFPKNIKEKTKATFESFYEDMPKKRHFPLFFIINVSCWIIFYLITYIIGVSLGINVEFLYFIAILPIVSVVSLLPITINGFGTREAALISLFSIFNIEAAKVFSMSILSLVISGLVPAMIGLAIIIKEKSDKWKK